MRRLLPGLLLAASCGNYGNVYLPQGERKPFSGPEPAEFPAALPAPVEVTGSAKIRLNVAPGAAELRASWTSREEAAVVFRVNARKLAEASCAGECALARSVPAGTILKDVATLIEVETTAPITITALAIAR